MKHYRPLYISSGSKHQQPEQDPTLDYRTIETRKGEVIKVSPEDYDTLRRYTWRVNTQSGYVVTGTPSRGNHKTMHHMILGSTKRFSSVFKNSDKLDNRRSNLVPLLLDLL